jgi:hypothetical protein
MCGIRGDVNGTARLRRDDDEAIRGKDLAGAEQLPASHRATEIAGDPAGLVGPAIRQNTDALIVGGLNANRTAERIGSVQVAGAATRNLDPIDRRGWKPIPVDPSSEGVVQRQTVGEYHGAACARGRQPPQRYSLRRRIGDTRRRAAEEAETWRAA